MHEEVAFDVCALKFQDQLIPGWLIMQHAFVCCCQKPVIKAMSLVSHPVDIAAEIQGDGQTRVLVNICNRFIQKTKNR